MVLNIGIHLSSAKITCKNPLEKLKNKVSGTAKARVKNKPALITFRSFILSFSALYLVINLETVMGVPELHKVSRSAKTERATW